jgi:hypothetical protein
MTSSRANRSTLASRWAETSVSGQAALIAATRDSRRTNVTDTRGSRSVERSRRAETSVSFGRVSADLARHAGRIDPRKPESDGYVRLTGIGADLGRALRSRE